MEKSNLEYLLEQLINGEGLTDFVPRSRMEEHLLAIINNTGIENLGSPRSRAEVLLQVLAEQGVGGGAKLEAAVDAETGLLSLDGAEVVGNTLVLPKGSASVEGDTLIIN